MVEQANNTKSNVRIEFRGKSKTVAEWCRELKLPYHTTRTRIARGNWTAERAFETPINIKHRAKLCQT